MYDWLLKNGVIFNTKKLKSLEEVDGYDLVINSSGCGAKYLGVFSHSLSQFYAAQSRSCNSLFPYVYFRITELWTSMV